MKKKKGLFVPEALYEKAYKLCQSNNIPVTSRWGLFVFDGVSLIIGLTAGVVFGIIVF